MDFFYAISFGVGMLIGLSHWLFVFEEGIGSGIVFYLIALGTIGSAALGSFAVWIARKLTCKIAERRPVDARIRQLKARMEQWKREGYDVSELEDLFK